jgi:hypothetical protein
VPFTFVRRGVWYRVPRKPFVMRCCECGLAHEMRWRIRDGGVEYCILRRWARPRVRVVTVRGRRVRAATIQDLVPAKGMRALKKETPGDA